MQDNVPGPLLQPIDDIEAVLGPPVTIISGVKIYDTTQLYDPAFGIVDRWAEQEKLFRYTKQPRGELSHLFIARPLEFIDQLRQADAQTEGLFPPLELTISTLATAYRLLNDKLFSQAPANQNILRMHNDIIDNTFSRRTLGIDNIMIPSSYVQQYHGNEPEYDANLQLLREVAGVIKLTYTSLGYEWSYFGFVKRDHPLRMAKVGRVPLKPNTFEAFGLFKLAPEEYLRVTAGFNGRNHEGLGSCFRGVEIDIPRMAGWKKQDLVDAIKRSGLWKDVSGLKRITYTKDPETRRMGIAISDLRLIPSHNDQEVVRGLGRVLYMPLCYYEALYRKVYSTSDYIDWPLLCQAGAVSKSTIGKVAVDLYQANEAQVANASTDEICTFVTETSRRRRQVTRTLALATQEAREGFVGQPGSRWVQPSVLQRRGPLGEAISQPANDYQLYQAVKQYCQNPELSKDQLLGYTVALNIRSYLPDNVEQYSKGDLCEYLLDFLLPRAQKYESVLVDCDDPAVDVRQILNAATIMELEGIFPKDVSKLSKTDACQIIANYIKLLREGVDLTVAK